jgi:hypothetical protein
MVPFGRLTADCLIDELGDFSAFGFDRGESVGSVLEFGRDVEGESILQL